MLEPTLMYAMVFSSLGLTTCSSAFTRRLVVLMASSRVRKAVCSEASSTSSSTADKKLLRQSATCLPPEPRPARGGRGGACVWVWVGWGVRGGRGRAEHVRRPAHDSGGARTNERKLCVRGLAHRLESRQLHPRHVVCVRAHAEGGLAASTAVWRWGEGRGARAVQGANCSSSSSSSRGMRCETPPGPPSRPLTWSTLSSTVCRSSPAAYRACSRKRHEPRSGPALLQPAAPAAAACNPTPIPPPLCRATSQQAIVRACVWPRTCASWKNEAFMRLPISSLASTIFFRMRRNRMFSASAFFFSSEWPAQEQKRCGVGWVRGWGREPSV